VNIPKIDLSKYDLNRLIDAKFETPISNSFTGNIYCWDIDQTYLDTKFEHFHDILKIPLEKAHDKKNMPGAVPLLQALYNGAHDDGNQPSPIYFISASPPQLRAVIQEKMRLDKIVYAGTILKNQIYNIKKGKFGKLTQQLGYKLSAILQNKITYDYYEAKEIFFGDSSENDTIVYSLYNDIISGDITENALGYILEREALLPTEISYIKFLTSQIKSKKRNTVEHFYILIVKNHSDDEIEKMSRFKKCIPIFNYFEAALHCYQYKRITLKAVIDIGKDLLTNYNLTKSDLTQSLDRMISNGTLRKFIIYKIKDTLLNNDLINSEYFTDHKFYWWNFFTDLYHQLRTKYKHATSSNPYLL